MKFLTIRDLRSSTASLDAAIEQDGTVVVTNKGKPAYIMIGVDEADFEETLIDLRRVRAKRAVARMQRVSARLGNAQMTLEEINAEIAAARGARP
jgi:PHD/YefM family antitoxin component YafN of YafNO toxin-antitoxin module